MKSQIHKTSWLNTEGQAFNNVGVMSEYIFFSPFDFHSYWLDVFVFPSGETLTLKNSEWRNENLSLEEIAAFIRTVSYISKHNL